MFLQYSIWGAWLPFLFSFLKDHRHMSPDKIGGMFAAGAVGAIFGPFFAGQLADRLIATEKLLALLHALYRVIWVDDGDLSSDDDLRAAAKSVGLDGDEALSWASSDAMKAALREATDGAVKRGVFGVPTFDVDGELYWGQDRIELVEMALGGPAPASANP